MHDLNHLVLAVQKTPTIPLNILCPNMTSLYPMSRMTMVVLTLEPCNIFSASCNKFLLIYKLV
jgi:hypothetical protein